jgi:hypothetical protein
MEYFNTPALPIRQSQIEHIWEIYSIPHTSTANIKQILSYVTDTDNLSITVIAFDRVHPKKRIYVL